MKVSHSLPIADRKYLKELFDIPDNKTGLFALQYAGTNYFSMTFYIKGINCVDFLYRDKLFMWNEKIEITSEDIQSIIRLIYKNYKLTFIKNKLST